MMRDFIEAHFAETSIQAIMVSFRYYNLHGISRVLSRVHLDWELAVIGLKSRF